MNDGKDVRLCAGVFEGTEPDRQLDALAEFGVADDMVFADKASGKNFEQPEYKRLISTLREDDVVVVVRVGWF